MIDPITLQSQLDAANERCRILEERATRLQRENAEIRSRNDALESANVQLLHNVEVLRELGWRKDPGDLSHD